MYSDLQTSAELRRPIASATPVYAHTSTALHVPAVDPSTVTPGMNAFVDLYHPAVRAFIGSFVRETNVADELTQKFFLEVVLQGQLQHSIDPRSGHFREDLKQAVRQFLTAERRSQGRTTRRTPGPVIHTDPRRWGRGRVSLTSSPAHDSAFLRGWAQGIVATALRQVSESFRQKGKQQHFRLFVGRFLAPADQMPTWRTLGEPFALGEKIARNRAETAARHVRAAIRQLVATEAGSAEIVNVEIRELISLF